MRFSFFVGCVVAIIVLWYVTAILDFMVGKLLGLKFLRARFLVFDIHKLEDTTEFKVTGFVPTCKIMMWEGPGKINKKKDMIHTIMSVFIEIAIAVAAWLILGPKYFWVRTDIAYFWTGVCIALSASALIKAFFFVKILIGDGSLREMGQNNVRLLQSGADYEMLQLPFEEIQKKDSTSPENDINRFARILCCTLYFNKHFLLQEKEALTQCAHEIEKNLPHKYMEADLPGYATLIFYYSYVDYNPVLAKQYYLKAKADFDKDMDPSGCRHRAYYQYYVCQDEQAARQTLRTGMDGLRNAKSYYLTEAETKLEAKLLTELAGKIGL